MPWCGIACKLLFHMSCFVMWNHVCEIPGQPWPGHHAGPVGLLGPEGHLPAQHVGLRLRQVIHALQERICLNFLQISILKYFCLMYGLNFKSLEIYSLASIFFNCTQHGPSLVNIWDHYEKKKLVLIDSKVLPPFFLTLHLKANLWWKSETSTQKLLIFHFPKNLAVI